jgi:hypothetical protein
VETNLSITARLAHLEEDWRKRLMGIAEAGHYEGMGTTLAGGVGRECSELRVSSRADARIQGTYTSSKSIRESVSVVTKGLGVMLLEPSEFPQTSRSTRASKSTSLRAKPAESKFPVNNPNIPTTSAV